MTTPTAVNPGAIALARLEHEAGEKFIGSKPQPKTALADLRALMAERDKALDERDQLARKLMEARDDWQASKVHAERLEADVRAMRRSLLIIAQGRTTDAMRVASDALLDHDDRQVKP